MYYECSLWKIWQKTENLDEEISENMMRLTSNCFREKLIAFLKSIFRLPLLGFKNTHTVRWCAVHTPQCGPHTTLKGQKRPHPHSFHTVKLVHFYPNFCLKIKKNLKKKFLEIFCPEIRVKVVLFNCAGAVRVRITTHFKKTVRVRTTPTH